MRPKMEKFPSTKIFVQLNRTNFSRDSWTPRAKTLAKSRGVHSWIRLTNFWHTFRNAKTPGKIRKISPSKEVRRCPFLSKFLFQTFPKQFHRARISAQIFLTPSFNPALIHAPKLRKKKCSSKKFTSKISLL